MKRKTYYWFHDHQQVAKDGGADNRTGALLQESDNSRRAGLLVFDCAGATTAIGGMDANGNALVARFTDQSLDPTFGTDGVTRLYGASLSPIPINALALEPDGSILAGGTDVYKLTGS
ncbi:MAG TPA: hypothetical protein VFC78_14785 [Tepidisphaeraceae bacterium]|nr:hypothetical protein [Tepidisphaeraceae bacterium]